MQFGRYLILNGSVTSQDLGEIFKPIVESFGCELWGIDFNNSGRSRLLRIYIDKTERPIDVKDCEKVSRQISGVLDVEETISGDYVLEVSSPGIDRPLFSIDQFKMYIGSKISLKSRIQKEGRRKFNGVLKKVDAQNIEVEVGKVDYVFPHSNIESANLISDY